MTLIIAIVAVVIVLAILGFIAVKVMQKRARDRKVAKVQVLDQTAFETPTRGAPSSKPRIEDTENNANSSAQ